MAPDLDDPNELRRRLREAVKMRGVDAVAADVPADRSTIFRFLRGETKRPAHAVREGIERVLDDEDLSHLRRNGRS